MQMLQNLVLQKVKGILNAKFCHGYLRDAERLPELGKGT